MQVHNPGHWNGFHVCLGYYYIDVNELSVVMVNGSASEWHPKGASYCLQNRNDLSKGFSRL